MDQEEEEKKKREEAEAAAAEQASVEEVVEGEADNPVSVTRHRYSLFILCFSVCLSVFC